MRKMKQKFPVGTLIQATIPRVGAPPHVMLGLVISHVEGQANHNYADRVEVFLGPNDWVGQNIVKIRVGRLKSVSRAYAKGG